MTELPIDIIVVTYNRIKYFKTFVKFLYSSTNYNFRLIVVDNGSIDGTREYIEQLGRAGKVWKYVFTSENLPLAKAFTEGFKHVESELFVTVADDMVINPELKHDWLRIFKAKMDSDQSIGSINFVGSRCVFDKFVKRYENKQQGY